MFKVNNKDTRVTSLTSFWCLYCYLWTCFTPFSSVFTVNFEQVNMCCRNQLLKKSYFCFLCFLFFFCRNQLLEKFSFFFFLFFYLWILPLFSHICKMWCDWCLFSIFVACAVPQGFFKHVHGFGKCFCHTFYEGKKCPYKVLRYYEETLK